MDDGQARGESRVWHISYSSLRQCGGIDDDVRSCSPQFKFPVHQGILDYDGTKCVLHFTQRSYHFFVFLFSTLLSLRTRLFFRRAGAPASLCSVVFLRTRTRSFPSSGTCRALRAFFLARRRVTRSGSTALAALRSALDKWASCAPSFGLPFGTASGVGFVDSE